MKSLNSDLSSLSTGICLWKGPKAESTKSCRRRNARNMEEPRPSASEKNTDENFIKTDLSTAMSTGNETLEGNTLSASSCETSNGTAIPEICVQPVQHWRATLDHKNTSVLDHLGVDKAMLKLPNNNNILRKISEDKTAAAHEDKDKLRPDDRLARRRKQSLSLDPQILLQWAATHNDVETLKNVLEGPNVDINQPGVDGFYALHRAASTGSFECLQYLVTKGAQLEVRDKDGSSPLDAAVFEGEFDCARFLIEKGASIRHIRDGFTDTKLVKIRGRKRVMTLI